MGGVAPCAAGAEAELGEDEVACTMTQLKTVPRLMVQQLYILWRFWPVGISVTGPKPDTGPNSL